MTVVKICGITNLDDALAAVECGANALGFNFFDKSPRFVDADTVRNITRQLAPSILTFGVFVNAPVGYLLEVARTSGIKWLQLHGDETPSFVSTIRTAVDISIMKALRIDASFTPKDAASFYADAFLLDAYTPGTYGGTGNVFDWTIAARANRPGMHLYLAGGLTAANVTTAIHSVRPFAVDACSSLEVSPGRKSRDKMARFIQAVREADA